VITAIDEAVAAGARQRTACGVVGINARTLQRWTAAGGGTDQRRGPHTPPPNALTTAERQHVLDLANRPEFRDLAPSQIVPRLADQGTYVASESTMYRVLHAADQQQHREPTAAPTTRHRPTALTATGPNQVWSWDITYLRSPIRGQFYYLYVVTDVWSRAIVAWTVHATECSVRAAALIDAACAREGVARDQLTLHADNGSPMKGATMLATLQYLGVAQSFSRPSVSNDNPYSESLFGTCKRRPNFPSKPFASLEAATAWVTEFVRWYNTEHRHSGIRYVTPAQRHAGESHALLAQRAAVYAAAKAQRPERWSGATRNWRPIDEVVLNPAPAAAMDAAA